MDMNLDRIAETYKDDLPSPELLQMELKQWKFKFMATTPEERPSSQAATIKVCDQDSYPNIFILLQMHVLSQLPHVNVNVLQAPCEGLQTTCPL